MAGQNQSQEQDLNQVRRVRREKLAELQQAGKDPFVITKYDVSIHTQEIKDHFDYFPPRNYWDVLITLFQKEDLTAKETDQALELSWIKE